MPLRKVTYVKRGQKKSLIKYTGKRLGTTRYKRAAQIRNKTSVPVGLGFPKRMVMTHRYCENVDLTSASGVINKVQYSCNSMFDPYATGTGHQPYYFDQMTAIYNHYTVIGSKIKLTIVPFASNTDGMFVGLYKDDDTTTTNVNDITVLAEQSQKAIRTIPLSSTNSHYLTSKWSAKKTFGGSILGNDDLQGNIAASPTEQTYYTIAGQAFGTSTGSLRVTVEISYIAVWDELKAVTQS